MFEVYAAGPRGPTTRPASNLGRPPKDGHGSQKGLPLMSRTTYRVRGLLAVAAAAAALALPASASAGPLIDRAPSCDSQVFSQPFLPWNDLASYTLNPGGSFEDRAAGWALDGASVQRGNEPFYVTGANDRRLLDLSAGDSAISAPVCVGIEHPDIRFFASASSLAASLSVDVLFEDAGGKILSAPIGTVSGSSGWAPTAPFPIVANLLPLLPGNRTAVAFRFRATRGSFQIDDLYVDPYQRR